MIRDRRPCRHLRWVPTLPSFRLDEHLTAGSGSIVVVGPNPSHVGLTRPVVDALRPRLTSRRGPVDLLARVAAVSPVIQVRDAAPFFMVEVEEAEQTEPPPAAAAGEEGFTGAGEAGAPALGADGGCPRRPDQRRGSLARSPASPDPWRGRAGGTDHAPAGPAGSLFPRHVLSREAGRERVVPAAAAGAAAGAGGSSVGSPGISRAEDLRKAGDGSGRAPPGTGGGRREQLMAMLVLHGTRCLAWQAFVLPGRTYVFPGLGAILLGARHGARAYAAFGDALAGGRGGRRAGGPGAGEGVKVSGRAGGPGWQGKSSHTSRSGKERVAPAAPSWNALAPAASIAVPSTARSLGAGGG